MTIIVICYVAVDGIAFVATFYKSYFSLILSQLFLRLRVSFLSTLPMSEQSPLCSDVFLCLRQKRRHPSAPLLLFNPNHRRWIAVSLANSLWYLLSCFQNSYNSRQFFSLGRGQIICLFRAMHKLLFHKRCDAAP